MADATNELYELHFNWLSRRVTRFGCSICHAAASQIAVNKRDTFATCSVTVLKKSIVLRHQNSALHKRSCEVAAGCQPDKTTPSAEQFDRLWEHRRTGGSLDARLEGLTAKTQDGDAVKKLLCMQWCLAEAKRAQYRDFIRRAASATLSQDARQTSLMVRLAASTRDVEQRVFTLGIITTLGGASNLCMATIEALEKFCTPGHGMPVYNRHGGAAAGSQGFDKELLKHLCSIITWWYSDAASEELSAGEMLTVSAAARQLFPNLKIIGRDKAHASRRVLEKPRKADVFLDEVATTSYGITKVPEHCYSTATPRGTYSRLPAVNTARLGVSTA